MSRSGSIRKVFPGGNTSQGFYSFYDQIIDASASKVFILKGGPGVGKSTLITNVAEKMLQRGYDVEYHCCSSDNQSYDGLVIPDLQVAIIDGTSPHIFDPRHPGAVDEIVNLGIFWSEEKLVEAKKEIIQLTKEVRHLFMRCYGCLAQAKLLKDEIKSYYVVSSSLDYPALSKTALQLIREILDFERPLTAQKTRHLFASAITPQGPTHHLPTLFDSLEKRYIITGPMGTGKGTIVNKIYTAAVNLGYRIEAFHCALEPDKIEHLIFPEISVGIITSSTPHTYQPQPDDRVINTGKLLNWISLEKYESDLAEASRRFDSTLQRGIEFLSRTKARRDELERYYSLNMDFEALNSFRDKLVERIEILAEKKRRTSSTPSGS
ncbi:MAG: PRK06851 family protein [Bacillota bacterium]|jgi:hypothetical protein